MPGMEVGGACGALPPGTEDADLLPVFFDCRKLKETVGRRLSARVEREQKIITEKQP